MKLYYDFHIHSCLSPCGDDAMLPADIAGMAKINGLDMVALTDHNTAKNCPAFFEACEFYGVTPIAGMELTTAEDVHIVCLFPTLEKAMEFDKFIESRLSPVKNKAAIFGRQNIVNADGETLGEVENLLIAAAQFDIGQAVEKVRDLGGICYPAHIDRDSGGIIAMLGDIPADYGFNIAEIHDKSRAGEFLNRFPQLKDCTLLSSSDAHTLLDINQRENYVELNENSAKCLMESFLLKNKQKTVEICKTVLYNQKDNKIAVKTAREV